MEEIPAALDALLPMWASNRRLFIDIMEALPMGVLIIDRGGTIVYCNEMQARIDGIERDFIVGKPETDIYGPYMGEGIMRSSLDTGRPILGAVCHYRTVRGKIVNGAYWVFPIRDGGEIRGSLCLTKYLPDNSVAIPAFAADGQKAMALITSGDQDGRAENTIVGANKAFRRALNMVQTTATSPSPVLISGETGTGKEMFVRAILAAGNRRDKRYQAINCSAIPATLLEGMLFGATHGSYTGAVDRPGLFEEANHGTIYLDEIDSMPLELQPKLLRVIQEMRVRRLGSSEERPLDVKVISSIGTSPAEVLAKGKMRPDLFYRLAVISVVVPPLRERMDDLEPLINHFLAKYNKLLGKNITRVDGQLMGLFRAYNWPGNVRELEYVLAGAINLAAWENILHVYHIPDHHRQAMQGEFGIRTSSGATQPYGAGASFQANDWEGDGLDLAAREALAIKEALGTTGGSVSRAAQILGISRQLLSYKMKKHGITRLDFKRPQKALPEQGLVRGTA